MTSLNNRPLRPGDVVEVRSAAEILATLDSSSAIERMPFMPEMARYAGRRYTVSRRVDKICDTISATGSRRLNATVFLEDLRCDGAGHDGCQAGCMLYWKEAWLRRVDDHFIEGRSGASAESAGAAAKLDRLAQAGTRTMRELEGKQCEVWRCQATEAFKASSPLKTSDLSQYYRELRNGNFGMLRFFGLLTRGFVMEIARRIGLLRALPLRGQGNRAKPAKPLDLQPGDLVQVRFPAEIAATLDERGLNLGLSFDREMLPYCGRKFRIRDRVRRIVDDKTGRMLKIPKDSLILEGAICSGERTPGNWFCPRQIYPFWREAWLRRVEEAATHVRTDTKLSPETTELARSAPEHSMSRVRGT
ncbi:hypothetical protein [Bradyrhizobium sp. CCBAU 45384]|uniref:hypothetical protein n=1 Tax=Bradyrhizobium sp. CCBAU 45384 TaxID=858428 RepID=UPI002306A5EC|nr:hypothetical protein [Bradyrhizobium sp. CCBAU 45384]